VTALVVIAKAPVPGRVKTRLCPPLSPEEAARLAEGALRDTLAAARAVDGVRRILCLDGAADGLGEGFELLAQRGDGLGARLAAMAEDVGEPFFVVGMDTPQVTPEHLRAGLAAGDAIGPAEDGGYWGLGLARADPRAFAGVPMSRADTGARQVARLHALGLTPRRLPTLRDVDHVADVAAVAATIPGSHFARAWAAVSG
jgi:rSAM/selenodomain-associated transferase 1